MVTGQVLSRAEYRAFVEANPDLRLERNSDGEVIIMPPVHVRTGYQSGEIFGQLRDWARRDGSGVAFDSSTGFDLPNGSNRAPDASWVPKYRLQAFTEREWNDYGPFCPDFVVELRSKSDRLSTVLAKMREYIDNGARLCWLVDPIERRVHVFRPGATETLNAPSAVRGDPELPGFLLDLTVVWTLEV